MVKKTIAVVILLMCLSSVAISATYYMAPATSGGSDSNDGSSGSPWLTLAYSLDNMGGSNTLIIRDGTYTGASNRFTTTQAPPVGSSGAYTTIKAENDGGAVFDGETTSAPFYIETDGNKYWQFEGLVFINSSGSIVLRYSDYVKFLRCGFNAKGASGAQGLFLRESSYVLAEGCYAWGCSRYQFESYLSDHIIFRHCVGRPDDITAGTNPAAAFAAYSSNYVLFQNCIAIDADQTGAWSGIDTYAGSFCVPTTAGASTYIYFKQCVALNIYLRGLMVAQNATASNIYYDNCVFWHTRHAGSTSSTIHLPDGNVSVSQCSFGDEVTTGHWADGYNISLYTHAWTNNIITDVESGELFVQFSAGSDYNARYGNTGTAYVSCGSPIGTNDITGINPVWSESNSAGALKYIVRTETGNSLASLGSTSNQIGANAITLIGSAGTLWGETGYDTDTEESMWPFPNESLIKTKMAAYSGGGVSGARGFAASGTRLDGGALTLTSYIWEYLGNQIPCSIYGNCGGQHSGGGTGGWQ